MTERFPAQVAAILISVLANQYAVLVSQIVEFIEMVELVEPPRKPSFLLGVLVRREQTLPVVDMAYFLGLSEEEEPQEEKVLLLVNMAGGMVAIPCESSQEGVFFGTPSKEKVTSPVIQRDSELYSILDLAYLATEEEKEELSQIRQILCETG